MLAGGAREIGNGSVTNAGTLDVQADLNTANGAVSPMSTVNQATVTVAPSVTWNAATVTNAAGTITNNGHVLVSDFTQAAGVTSPNPIEFAAGGTFHRTGAGAVAVVVPAGQQLNFDGNVLGAGQTLDLVAAQLVLGQDLTNNSSITVEGSGPAVVNLAGRALVNAGTLSVLAGGAREIGNGSVTNTGTLDVQADLNTANGAVSPMSTVNQATVTVAPSVTWNAATVTNAAGTITNNGHVLVSDFTQAAGVTSPNPIEFAAGGTFHRTGAGAVAVVVPAGQQLNFDGNVLGAGQTLDLVAAQLVLGQDLTNNSSITVEGSGPAVVNLAGRALVNAGTLSVLAGGAREIGNGSVTNTGTLDVQADLNTANGAVSPMSTVNQATVTVAPSVTWNAATVTNAAGTITNNGHVLVSDFTQAAGVTSPNPIEFAAGGTFHRTGAGAVAVVVPAGQQLNFDGNVLGAGQTLDLVAAQLVLGQDLTNNSSITVEGSGPAVVNLAGRALVNAGTLSVLAGGAREIGNGSVTNTGTLDVQADLNTANGAVSPMAFTQASTGVVHTTIDGSGSFGHVGASAASLDGTLSVTTTGSPASPSSYDVVTGSSVSGQFSTLDFGTRRYETTYSPGAVTLSIPGGYSFGSLTLSSTTADDTGVTYTLGFAGAALTGGSSTLTLTAPAGTVFPNAAGCTFKDTTTNTSAGCANVSGGGSNVLTITAPFNTALGDHLELTVTGVTNPLVHRAQHPDARERREQPPTRIRDRRGVVAHDHQARSTGPERGGTSGEGFLVLHEWARAAGELHPRRRRRPGLLQHQGLQPRTR